MNTLSFRPLVILLGFLVTITTLLAQTPTVSSVSPSKGPAGTTVTISGSNFSTPASNNSVFFGQRRVTVNGGSSTSLNVTTTVGSSYGPVTVGVGNRTGSSTLAFVPTFTGGDFTSSSMSATTPIKTGATNRSPILADFNNDGKPDLAILSYTGSSVLVYQNTGTSGTISFGSPTSFLAGSGPIHMLAADIDGDGKLDLVITNELEASNGIYLLANNSTPGGAISFASKIALGTNPTNMSPRGFAIGDIDGDGHADIAVGFNDSYFRIFRGNGVFGFSLAFEDRTPGADCLVAIGDLNGDGKPDVGLSRQYNVDNVAVWQNSSTPGSILLTKVLGLSGGAQPEKTSFADMDGDGKLDVISQDGVDGKTYIFRNTSSGGSFSFAGAVTVSTSNESVGEIADMNGDGKPDYLMPYGSDQYVGEFTNFSTPGNLSFGGAVLVKVNNYPYGLQVGDLDGDGRPDIVAIHQLSDTVALVRNIVDPFSVSRSTVSLSSSSIPSSTTTTVTLQIKDASGVNMISTGLAVVFAITGGTSNGSISSTVDHGDGTYTAVITGTTAGTVSNITATVNGKGISSTAPTLTVTVGSLSIAASTFSVTRASIVSGTKDTLLVQTKDVNGNNLTTGGAGISFFMTNSGTSQGTFSGVTYLGNGLYRAEFTGTTPGTANQITATINGNSLAFPPSVTVESSSPSPSLSTISVSPSSVVAGNNITFTLTARNSNGTLIPFGGATVVFALSGGTSGGTIGGTSDQGNGKYSANLYATAAGTTSTVTATVNGNTITSALPTITVTPGPYETTTSTITVSPATIQSGTTSTITFQACDDFGNPRPDAGFTVTFGLYGNGSASGTFGPTTPHANGSYTSTFTGTTVGTANTIYAAIAGHGQTNNLTKTITVTPGIISTAQSIVSISDATVQVGITATLTLRAKDINGNNLTTGGSTVLFSLAGDGTSTGSFGPVTDNHNGTYTGSFLGISVGTPNTLTATIGGNSVTSTRPSVSVVQGSPHISSLSATSGTPGSSVTITGINFDGTTTNNTVYFGGVRAAVTAASATTLTVTVPSAVEFAPVTVINTVTGLSGTSPSPFLPLYHAGGFVNNQLLAARQDFSSTGVPAGIASGDLDGDGLADLVSANTTSGTISVFRNTSSTSAITFATRIDISSGNSPRSLRLTDLDGDGKLDVVVLNSGYGQFSVFRNTSTAVGTISFASAQTFFTDGTGMFVNSLTTGDIDGDGKPDVAVSCGSETKIATMINTSSIGSVSFSTGVTVPTNAHPYGIMLKDLDGDGYSDLGVVYPTAQEAVIFRNTTVNGVVSFGAAQEFGTNGQPLDLNATDLNGDGKPELVTSRTDGGVMVFLNTSTTGAISFNIVNQIIAGVTSGSRQAAFADMDGDGVVDIVIPNSSGISVVKNTSTDGMLSFGSGTLFAGNISESVTVPDFNGDGIPDIALGNSTASNIGVFKNTAPAYSLSKSTLTLSQAFIQSDSSSTITLQLKDSYGVNLTSGGATVLFSLAESGTSNGTFSGVTDHGNGSYTGVFTGTTAGTIRSMNATINGVALTSSLPQIQVKSGVVSESLSTVSVSANQVASGNSVTVTFHAKDRNNNTITSGGSTVSYFVQATGTSTGTFGPISDNNNGTYTASFTGVLAGTAIKIGAMVDGDTVRTSYPLVSVIPGTYSVNVSFVTVSRSNVPSDSTIIADLHIRDLNGNPTTILGNNFVIFGLTGVGTSSGVFSNLGWTNDTMYSSSFTGLTAGTANSVLVTIGGVQVTTAHPGVTVIPGVVYPQNCFITSTKSTLQSDSSCIVTLHTVDKRNNQLVTGGSTVSFGYSNNTGTGTYGTPVDNNDGTYSVQFTGILTGQVRPIATIDANPFQGMSLYITITPGVPSIDSTVVSILQDHINAGGSTTFLVYIRDAHGNGMVTGGTSVQFALFGGTSNGSIGQIFTYPSGEYRASFTGTTAGTTSRLSVTLDGILDTLHTPTITVSQNPNFSSSLSTWTLSRSLIKLGDTTLATLHLVDQFGNGFVTPTTNVLFRFLDGNGGEKSDGTFSPAMYLGNGVYTSIFTGGNAGSSRTMYVTVDLGLINGSQQIQVYGFPRISSISTTSAFPGDGMNISGQSFNATAANNIVYVGNMRATVTGGNTNSIDITIPPGTEYGPVTVSDTTIHALSVSGQSFAATFHGDGTITGNTFLAPAALPVQGDAYSVISGDLDGDGKPDLISTNNTTSSFSIYPNTGHPDSLAFGTRIDIGAGASPDWASLADVDGDGRIDIAISNLGSNSISVYKNTSSGPGVFSFASPVTVGLSGSPRTVRIIDVDGDGHQDLVACISSQVSIFLGDGNFNFTSGLNITGVGTFLFGAIATDLTGDGKPDIAVADFLSGVVRVVQNTSTPGLLSFASPVSIATISGFVPTIKAGDLDGDGLADIAATSLNGGSVYVFRNTSSGNSISFSGPAGIGTSGGAQGVAFGDLNGDGKSELIVSSFNNSILTILPNTSSPGTISFSGNVNLTTGPGSDDLAIVDLDGDGKNEMISANRSGNNLGIYRNVINTYSLSQSTISVSLDSIPSQHYSTITLRLKDVRGLNVTSGGNTVLFSLTGGTSTVSLGLVTDNHDGTYSAQVLGQIAGTALAVSATVDGSAITSPSPNLTVIPGTISTANSIVTLAKASIPIGTQTYVKLQAIDSLGNNLIQGGATVAFTLTGTGNGTFTTVSDSGKGTYSAFLLGTMSGTCSVGATINGVTVTTSPAPVTITLGKSTITSVSPITTQSGSQITIHGIGFNTDTSFTKVATGGTRAAINTINDSLITATVSGGALFGPVTATDVSSGLTSASPLPFYPTYQGSDTLAPESFDGRITHDTSVPLAGIALSDLDGDGLPDILCIDNIRNWFFAYHNISTPNNFQYGNVYVAGGFSNVNKVMAADLDGDGRNDVIVGNQTGNHVSMLHNSSTPGTIDFNAKIDMTTPGGVMDVAVGDVDGDGRPEVITRNNGGNSVTVFANTSSVGSLSFTNAANFGGDVSYYTGVATGDIDGDGLADVIVTNGPNNSMTVFRSQSSPGTFSFDGGTTFGTGGYSSWCQVGDIDGDGKNDVVIATYSGSVVVLRNTSTPGVISFDAATILSNPRGTMMVALADIDGDGKLDIGCANGNNLNNTSSLIKNISTPGTIAFEPEVEYATDSYQLSSKAIALGDVDGDERPDMVVANGSYQSRTFAVRRNVTSRISRALSTATLSDSIVYEGFTGTIHVATKDPHGSDRTKGGLSVSFALAGGTSAGTFDPVVDNHDGTYSAVFHGTTPGSVCSVYVAVDGKQLFSTPLLTVKAATPIITSFSPVSGKAGTLVTIHGNLFDSTASNDAVWFGGVQGTVTHATSTTLSVIVPASATYGPLSVTNLTTTRTGSSILPFRLTYPGKTFGAGSMAAPISINSGGGSYGIAAGDLDNDGKSDFAVLDPFGGSVMRLFRNTTTNSNSPTFSAESTYAVGSFSWANTFADLNNDGKLDAIVTNLGASTISVFQNRTTGSILSFNPGLELSTGSAPVYVSAGDLNGDGKPEIVTGNNNGSLSIFRNTGVKDTLAFAPSAMLSVGSSAFGVAIGDFDGDGKRDLALANSGAGSLTILRNITSGDSVIFAAPVDYPAGGSPTLIASADFDGDGKLDLVVTNQSSSTISLYRNKSAGAGILFANGIDISTGGSPTGVSIGDFNGDGSPDIAVANTGGSSVSVFINHSTSGAFQFDSQIVFSGAGSPLALVAADVSGDGKPDILAANSVGNTPIYRNQIQLSAAGFTASASTVAFGSVALGNTKHDTVTVRNSGTDTLKLSATISGDTTLTTSFTNATIAPGDSTRVIVSFTPVNTSSSNALLVFIHNSISSPDTIPVSGTGQQLTISAWAGPHGSITPTGTMNVLFGASASYTIVPDTTYKVDSLIVDGTAIPSSLGHNFTNVSASHTIRVVFAINGSIISAIVNGHGTLSPGGPVVVAPGDSVTILITPDPGYHVSSVVVDTSHYAGLGSYTFRNVNAPHTITATFTLNTFISSIASGNWKDSSTWSFHRPPNDGDSVIISGTTTVVLDTDGVAGALNVAGTLTYDTTLARILVITRSGGRSGDVSITGGLTFDFKDNQKLILEGNFFNTGILGNNSSGTEGSAIVFDGNGNRTVSSTSTVRVLEVKNGMNLSASNAFTISSELIMINGKLILGASNVLLGQSTAVIGASAVNYVVTDSSGSLLRNAGTTATLFPVGTATSYNPVQVSTTTGTDTFSVRVLSKISPASSNDSAGIQRTFDLGKLHPATNNGAISMTVQWNTNEQGPLFVPTSAVSWYDDNGGWVEEGVVSDLDDTTSGRSTLTIGNISRFGKYTLGNPGALPIQLATFAGVESRAADQKLLVNLTWTTVSEEHLLGFYVERKTKGSRNFSRVSNLISAEGSTLESHEYKWVDRNVPTDSVCVYRLRVVDLSNTTTFTHEIEISNVLGVQENLEPLVFKLQQNYPNPFNPTTTVMYSIPTAGEVSLKVYNMLGQEVATLVNEFQAAGRYSVRWDASSLASGSYIYRLQNNGNVQVHKMLFLK